MKKLKRFTIFLIIIVGLFVYARYIEPQMMMVRYEEFEADIDEEIRIALFSDTHFGDDYSQEKIEEIVQQINESEPDIVVFTGDFFDNYSEDKDILDLDYLTQELLKIEAPAYACEGNHDVGGGAEFMFEEFMENAGFTVLTNENLYLKEYGINLVGLEETFFNDPSAGIEYLSETEYNLVLIHQADFTEEFPDGLTGLVLAGHSHGGQIYIPFITDMILPEGTKNFRKGFFEGAASGGTMDVYVTSGLGTTAIPMRFLNVPEIVIIDLISVEE